MPQKANHLLSWNAGNTLPGGFFLVILLGLAGYFHTVEAMQKGGHRIERAETLVHACISLAKDTTLASHDTASYTQSFVYTGADNDRERKWEAEDQTDAGFAALQARLQALPGSESLQKQCADAERQNRKICEPLEARAISLTEQGKQRQAQDLLEAEGTAARYNLELKLDDLIGVNPSQDAAAAPRGLVAYQKQMEQDEMQAMHRAVALGWVMQGGLLLVSLLIAVAVTRTVNGGIRAVLQAQDTLREDEARYRLLFESNPHPMFVYDRHSLRYLAVNQAAMRRYGYSHAEFLAMTVLDIRPPEDQEALRAAILEGTGPGTPATDHVWRHLTKDGDLLWVDIHSHPIIWAGRDAAMTIAQDITARREAEEGVSRLAAIVHSSSDAIIGWNAECAVTSWNPGAERLYGYTASEMIGQSIEILVPDGLDDEKQRITERLLAGLSVEIPDTVRLHKEGRRIEVSVSSSPIKTANGEIIGASTIARDISAQKRSQELIRWQAYTDPLTGLPNRARFAEELEEALAQRRPLAVLFIDLDLFKHVNDSLGHVAGDHMLQEVAGRFTRGLGPDDLLARMGGDEFTLLVFGEAPPPQFWGAGKETAFPNPAPQNWGGGASASIPDTARAAAERLLNALAHPIVVDGHELHVSASIGISLFPTDGADAETLLKHADLAMYQAKDEGRSVWRQFTPALTEAARERLTLENSLRKAMERDEFTLFYQPQVSLATGAIVGVEALVRWNHPDLGMVSPLRFIPLAEETGLILPLGEWVLRQACRQAADWADQGHPLRIAVNLSPRQLADAELVGIVKSALDVSGLDPHWLDLELTESALIAQGEAAVARLNALRALGLRVSVDDFGTGYSSLAYLRRFPLDILKVDRSFVLGLAAAGRAGVQDQAVVRAVIDMAHALALEVVAEGVETDAQRDILEMLGCDTMQGFLFSPPVPAERLQTLLPQNLLPQELLAA